VDEAGCFLWLRADLGVTYNSSTGKVSAWANQGSAGGSFAQSTAAQQPTFNLSATFNRKITWTHDTTAGASSSLRNASIVVPASDFTFFFIVNPTKITTADTSAWDNGLWLMDSYAGSGVSNNRLIMTHADYASTFAAPRVSYFTSSLATYVGRAMPTTGLQVLTFELSSNGTTASTIYRNGSAIASNLNYSAQMQINAAASGAGIGLGASNGSSNPAGSFAGDYYEVIGINTTNAAMRARVHRYIGALYGISGI
jgi:hypothetical protein